MPGAVGIALGDRARGVKRTVVATIGDGSFQYSVQSIWTAAQHRLPIVFVVMRNEEYVINTVSERMAAQVQACSESFPRSVSEVAEVGFHTLPSTLVRPSRIASGLCFRQAPAIHDDAVADPPLG